MLYKVSTSIAYSILKIFFNLKIEGDDVFPKEGPFILAANHASFMDPPVVASCCRRRVVFIATAELFDNKILGAYMKRVGVIPLKKETPDIGALKAALEVLKTRPLLIFPQGERTTDLDEVKSGIGFLCKKSGVPVVVARVYGTDQVLPRGANFLRKGKIRVIFSKLDNLTEEDTYENITAKVRDKIKSL